MLDVRRYVGVPYQPHGESMGGVDCWGLCRLIYREMRGVELPMAMYHNVEHIEHTNAVMEEMYSKFRRVDKVEPWAICTFRVFGLPSHVGMAVDAHNFIHASQGKMTAIERFESPTWQNRLAGIYVYD